MEIIYNNLQINSDFECELKPVPSFEGRIYNHFLVKVEFKNGNVTTLANVSEVHNRYFGDDRIAIESDFHSTGVTFAIKDIDKVFIDGSFRLHKTFNV